jgi:quinoprotein glucose dehydrogenase
MKIKIVTGFMIGLWIGVCHTAIHGQQPTAAHSVWDGVYTKEQAKRGEDLYAQNCGSCHGATLTGLETAPPLTGPDFNSNWNGLTLGDLFDRVRVSMPQDDPSKLSSAQKADVVAYILSYGKFPEGMTELPRETPVLSQIKFEALKP